MGTKIKFRSISNISYKTRYILEVFPEYKKIFKDDLNDCGIIELIQLDYK